MNFNMNIPLFKIDEEQKLVYGRATQEVLDKSDEIMDYESSKSNFEKWSNDFATRTGGKSYGNIRVQHDSKRVGGKIAEPLTFNDTDKAIDICVKVSDDNLFNEIKEGYYTGFSVGGSYGRQWTDDDGILHYTAIPSEISIVDNPCVGTATIMYVKADGTTENLKIGGKKMDKQEFEKALSDGDLKKAFSFKDISVKVNNAICEKRRGSYEYFWAEEIYADCVIIRMEESGDYYRIPYTVAESGDVTLGEAEKVVMEWKSVGEKTAEKAVEEGELAKASETETPANTKESETAETAETAESTETVEKTVEDETAKQDEPAEMTKADKPKEEAKEDEEESEGDSDGEEVEKAAKVEEDVFEQCSKALDNADDSIKEKCSKLFHKMVEKGLHCKCGKCSKAVEDETAEKAAADTDLHKTAEAKDEPLQKDVPANELAKAMEMIGDLKKGFDALKTDNETLKKQVEALENTPVAGGAMVSVGAMALNKTIGGNVGNPPAENGEVATLKKMIAETDSAMMKEAYSKQLAQIEMRKMYE
jgi:hypothetical protein